VKERNLDKVENCVLLKARVLGYSLPRNRQNRLNLLKLSNIRSCRSAVFETV